MSRIAAGAVALIAVTFASQAALRSETIHVPGTACRPKKSDVSKTNYNSTSIVNEATSSATVVCPVHYQDSPVENPIDLQIFVIDRSSSSNITCTVTGFPDLDISPGAIFQESGSSSGSKSSIQPIVGIDGVAFDLQGFEGLMFTFSCSLPSSSSSSNRNEVVDYVLENG